MNFTPELSAFQGAILSADNLHQFSRLSAKGGNEDAIQFVVESLLTFLEQGLYIVNGNISKSKESQVRKFALYLVLNADLTELQQMIEFEEISTLIWTTPTIPKCLMCELMWNLHMERFISEIICYTNPQLALDVASAFLEHFKYFNPLECLEQLQLLSTACYTLICRIRILHVSLPEWQNKATKAFNNYQQCLKYYTTPPNNYKLNALGQSELYKFQGKSLYSLLQVTEECLKQYTEIGNLAEFPEIYKLTFAESDLMSDSSSVSFQHINFWMEYQHNAHTVLLDICKVLVMDVSVDVFCCWSEIEENNKSMQQTIGELCYRVHSKLLTISNLAEHPVISMIEQISRKPVEMKDKINATEDAVIVQNINNNNNDESKAWIKALVHKEKLCQNSELLNITLSNIDMYNADECYKLYSSLKQYLGAENKDLIDLLVVKAFEKCDLAKKYDILEEHFHTKILIDMKETAEFKNAMTSIFNKFVVSPDVDLSDVLTLFLQNPQEVFLKIFKLASENAQQTQIMLKVMKLLEGFSDHYYDTATEPCVINITQKILGTLETEAQENNFIQFICGLKDANIISGSKLLLLIIMTNIHKALLKTDIRSLHLQLKLLKGAFKLEELSEYRAPMLAMLGQVLDIVRWEINTFCANAPDTLTLALNIQTAIMETYNGEIPDNQKQWLKSKLKNLKPLNLYYYRVLWDPPGATYLEILSGMTITKNMNWHVLTEWLSQVIFSCTQQEWCELWDCLAVFSRVMIQNIIISAVATVAVVEKLNRTDESEACIFYCYRNFMYVTRYKYLSEPLTDDQVLTVVKKTAMMSELIDAENVEEFGTILIPIFAYLMEKRSDYNINLMECLHKQLGHTKLAPVINIIFRNGTP